MSLYMKLMEAIGFRVTESSNYSWDCFPDAMYYDCISDFGAFGFVFSIKDQTVYEITASSEGSYQHGDFAYRWVNPDFIEAAKAESARRNLRWEEYSDATDYVELEDIDDIVEKGKALLAGEKFDTRVVIPIDLPDDILLTLFRRAHELDMTFNAFIEMIIRAELERVESEDK